MTSLEKDKRELNIATLKTSDKKFSRFFCQQFLYDYITNGLDVARVDFLNEQLKTDKDLKKELHALELAQKYAKSVGELKVHNDMMERFLSHKSSFDTALSKFYFKEWPDFLKWGAEALGIGVFVAFLMLIIPWDKIENKIVTTKRHEFFLGEKVNLAVTEEHKAEEAAGEDKVEPVAVAKDANQKDNLGAKPAEQAIVSLDSQPTEQIVAKTESKNINESILSTNVNSVATSNANLPLANDPNVQLTNKENVEQKVVQKEQPAVQAVATTPPPVPSKPAATVEVGIAQPTKALRGELYRLFMKVSNVDDISLTIKNEIEKLGGDKAGEVPLGWKKDGGSYFHFTIPANQHENLINQIKLLGPVSVQKESHWRVMPQGTHRMILNVMPKDAP